MEHKIPWSGKKDSHPEILLKMALNTITLTPYVLLYH
jgi:hypothetical protein